MEKFRFRLEKVKQFKEDASRDSKRELARQNARLSTAEDILSQLLEERHRQKLGADGLLTGADLGILNTYDHFLQNLLIKQRQSVQEAEIAVEKAREHVLEKAREEKALSLLKEKRFEEYQDEKKRQERKESSSLAMKQYILRELSKKE
ncbi:MAG TPA: flagellar export protein FliJ [Oligoflexia bacterium]|nr:flagellar export protein FliJ [Oligoflexia bacterium]HMP47586.1 flagellar export protein FliJ [Oligoflexia bacterium]